MVLADGAVAMCGGLLETQLSLTSTMMNRGLLACTQLSLTACLMMSPAGVGEGVMIVIALMDG